MPQWIPANNMRQTTDSYFLLYWILNSRYHKIPDMILLIEAI